MPISIWQLAEYRGAKTDDSGVISFGAFEAVGLPAMGGCARCGASVAAYNSAPSKHGVLMCLSGCIGGDGYDTVEEANLAIFLDAL